nr:MAG TPA: hypothetical protein [Caudoviricetes sp.]
MIHRSIGGCSYGTQSESAGTGEAPCCSSFHLPCRYAADLLDPVVFTLPLKVGQIFLEVQQ